MVRRDPWGPRRREDSPRCEAPAAAQWEAMQSPSAPSAPDLAELEPGDHGAGAVDATNLADRLRRLLLWAGIATLLVLTLLAMAHFVDDLRAILFARGGFTAAFGRIAPTIGLSLAALVTVIVVGVLAASGRRRELAAIGIGFVVLVGVRIFIAASLDGVPRGEPFFYGLRAEALLAGDLGFGDRPIGYTLMLAGSNALFPDPQLATEALNLLFALLVGGVVLAMARGSYGARVGALALLAYAMWPAGALMTTVRMPELAYDLAIAAAAWAVTDRTPGWRGSALTGVLLGLSQWIRPSTPALLAAFLLARIWPGGPWRRLIGSAVVPLLGMFLLVLTPVIWHNYQEHDELSVSTSLFGGQVFYLGTYEPSGGMYDQAAMDALIAMSGPDIEDISALGSSIAMDRIREDPLGIAMLAVRKQDTLWGTEHFGVEYGISRSLEERPAHPRVTTAILLSQGFYVAVLLAATVGLYHLRRRPDALAALVIVLIWSITAIHTLLEVRDRHHSYVIPVLLPIAALAVAVAMERLERLVSRPAER